MPEQIKRQTAYKLRVGDLLKGKPILEQLGEGEQQRFRFLELGDRNIVRVNIVANIIDKYESEASEDRKKYSNFTIDDASGQIRLKIWGDDTEKFSEIVQGNTVVVIGTLRFYNNELYISPEIIRLADPKYLLVRKLELDLEKPKEIDKQEVLAIKDQIIEMIKKAEEQGGLDTDNIYHTLTSVSPEIISQEIQKMLEEGLAYEPRPGKIRYLG
jgi:RPA family protein